jgi:ATP/maltotriose-dependent transcriptional regulator MalT
MEPEGLLCRTARAMEEEALALFQEVGDATGTAFVLQNLASVLSLQGEYGRAQALLEESLTLSRRGGDVWNITLSLLFLGWVSIGQGDYADARALLEESLEISMARGNMWIMAIGLVGLAAVATAQGGLVRAVWLMSAAKAVREAIGALLPPFVHVMYESTMVALRGQLGEQAFGKAWSEGRAMTLQQVLAAKDPLPMPAQLSNGFSSTDPAKTSHGYPDGLTAREAEVLRLVAQGLTDAQVAERLFISRRTVNWHLTLIYSKLQVSSRSAATRYALEHHLV